MKTRLTQSRTGILAGALLVAMAIFTVRLFYLQILRHGEYVALAERSQQRTFVLPAKRGQIYMMDGRAPVPVVLNRLVFTMIADPHVIPKDQHGHIVESLRQIAGGEMVSDVADRLAKRQTRYQVLAEELSLAQADALRKKDFPGILYRPTSVRSYAEGGLAGQVLGFVNAEHKGQYGVEEALDERLRGTDGMLRAVTDVRSVPLMIGKNDIDIKPKDGRDVILSIDRNVQSYAEEALRRGMEKAQATEGTMVVMNPNNGRIVAMANAPGFRPDAYGKVTDASVFVNGATMMPYDPASVIKTFTMATGIDTGAITPQSTYHNSDCTEVGDKRICNAVRGQVGQLTMQQALNNSHNVGTVTVGRRLGDGQRITAPARQKIYEYFHDRFGFGQKTGIELNEAAGIVHAPNSPEGNEVRYANMTFGQGMSLTTVQVLAAFASVVNGGSYYAPTIIAGEWQNGEARLKDHRAVRQTIKPETSAQMRQMLQTARASFWVGKGDKPGYMIGGKTGTGETVVNGSYTKSETIGTYLGFGGATRPEYVIMIRVAAPGKGLDLQGSLHAAPIFTDMSNWMIEYMKLAPRSIAG